LNKPDEAGGPSRGRYADCDRSARRRWSPGSWFLCLPMYRRGLAGRTAVHPDAEAGAFIEEIGRKGKAPYCEPAEGSPMDNGCNIHRGDYAQRASGGPVGRWQIRPDAAGLIRPMRTKANAPQWLHRRCQDGGSSVRGGTTMTVDNKVSTTLRRARAPGCRPRTFSSWTYV
jgi:hypothetical protein